MKFLINKKIKSNIPSTKVFDLGIVVTTIDDLLSDSTININQNTIPVLYFDGSSYLINNFNPNNYKEDFEIILTESDLLSIGGSGGNTVQSVTGDGVDNTDPLNPVISASIPTLVEVLKDPGADNFVSSSPQVSLANEFNFSDPAAKRLDLSPAGIGFYGNNIHRVLTSDRTSDEFANYILPLTGYIPGITSEAPVVSVSQGALGQMYLSSTDLYICIAPNTWRKVAITTF